MIKRKNNKVTARYILFLRLHEMTVEQKRDKCKILGIITPAVYY